MIVPRDKGPVGEWTFENGPISNLNWSTLEECLSWCSEVASIFSSHRLLFPKAVQLSQWMRASGSKVAESERVGKGVIKLLVDPSKGFKDVISRCREIIYAESVYPLKVEIFGSGVIVNDSAEEIVDDLIWIRATTLDILRLSIMTQSDVWLPYSLRAEPQYDIFVQNSDRLVSALEEVRRHTGFELEEGVQTHYSVVNGFHLENVRYADGSVVDLI